MPKSKGDRMSSTEYYHSERRKEFRKIHDIALNIRCVASGFNFRNEELSGADRDQLVTLFIRCGALGTKKPRGSLIRDDERRAVMKALSHNEALGHLRLIRDGELLVMTYVTFAAHNRFYSTDEDDAESIRNLGLTPKQWVSVAA